MSKSPRCFSLSLNSFAGNKMFFNISLIGFLANNFSFWESFLCCGSRVREEGQGQTNNAPWCQPCRKTTTKSDENFNDGISDPQYQQCIMLRDFKCAKHCHDNTRKEITQLEVVRFWRKLPLDFTHTTCTKIQHKNQNTTKQEIEQHKYQDKYNNKKFYENHYKPPSRINANTDTNTTRGSREQTPRNEVVQHPVPLSRSRRCTLGWIVA